MRHGLRIDRVGLEELDLGLADQLAAVAAEALEDVPVPRRGGPSLLLATTIGDGEDSERVLWVARAGDRVVGWAVLEHQTREYVDTAFLGGAVAPAHQRHGIGAALLDQVASYSSRPRLRARAFEGTAGALALPALGFEPRLTHVIRRLDLHQHDPGRAELHASAAAAAGDYELVRRVGPTPAADLAEMVALREAINDAPDALEFEAYPVDRISAYEQALVARRQTQYTVVARHRTGEPAGLTIVCVDEFDPGVAFQEDTSVLPAHRGHRLGLLLKLDMVEWLQAERPEVGATDTWNDRTNHHMIAVNERLGAREIARTTAYTRAR